MYIVCGVVLGCDSNREAGSEQYSGVYARSNSLVEVRAAIQLDLDLACIEQIDSQREGLRESCRGCVQAGLLQLEEGG